MLTRRQFLVGAGAFLVGPAVPSRFCQKNPNHPKCQPAPTPIPTPSPTPTLGVFQLDAFQVGIFQ